MLTSHDDMSGPSVRTLRKPSPRREHLSAQATLREVMSRFGTGVTVLTAGGSDAHGMTANAFSSVSLDPPMVLCCVARAARMHEAITSARSFAVSVLASEQHEVARYFADWRRPRGRAQFETVGWHAGPHTRAPLLDGALAWLECDLIEVYGGGDHSIFLGRVLGSRCGEASNAMVFCGNQYHEIPIGDGKAHR